MHLKYRTTCRACGSGALTRVVDLGEQMIQGAFIKPGVEKPSTRTIPLQLVRCDPIRDERACGLLQTSCSVPPEILYYRYWYRSGTNSTMRSHLRGLAEEAMRLVAPQCVLDIGCNDGTLLNFFPLTVDRVGVDPSNAILECPPSIKTIHDRFPSPALDASTNRFDVITSIAMFYDVEDPVGFAKAVRDHLATDGVWIFEMSYMPSMLRMNSYDTICHEHIEYYSLAVLEFILARAGMRIFRAELNDINGGSIRCYASRVESLRYREQELAAGLEDLRRQEFDLELETDRPYKNFQDRINQHRTDLNSLVRDIRKSGKRIHVYGASTKGNTILQWCGLDSTLIDFAADRNPDKYGARTLGSDIPIISEEESRALRPDVYLVLPWHFKREFVEREQDALRSGTAMIFPLPAIEIVGESPAPGLSRKYSAAS